MIHRTETALFNPKAIKNDMDKSRLLGQLLTQSMGFFRTEKVVPGGGIVVFIHDKPKLDDSKIIWKISADGMQVSTDGMRTWNAGIDANGKATVNLLEAIGINFDWASGGTLTLGGKDNKSGEMVVKNENGQDKVVINNQGISLKDGAELITEKGVLSTFNYHSGYMELLGGYVEKSPGGVPPIPTDYVIHITATLPDNFVPVRAFLTLDTYGTTIHSNEIGYSRNISLHTTEYTHAYNEIERITHHSMGNEVYDPGDFDGTVNGSSTLGLKKLTSGDLTQYLKEGITTFSISSERGTNGDYSYIGEAFANITVMGYLNYEGVF